jgi:hypothetical protein
MECGAAVAVVALAQPASAMTFKKVTSGHGCAERTCVIANGEIDDSTERDFTAFVRDQKIPRGAVVVLDSHGGNVVTALALGGRIRKGGFATSVQSFNAAKGEFVDGGECASACAYVFLSGVERDVGKGARVGLHQMFSADSRDPISVGDVQWFTNLLLAHVDRMGGRSGIVTLALRTPPQSMHWLSKSELNRLNMVTPAAVTVALGD